MITPNLDIVRQCVTDPSIRAIVDLADVRVADGMPVIWASRLQRTPLRGRVCGSDLISSLSAAAAEHGLRVYLLGGADDAAVGAGEILKERHPDLAIAGTYAPPFGFETDDAEINRIVERLSSARPDIIFIALGFPKAERLVHRIRATQPDAWWIGVGVSFSFLCGHVKRAPMWAQRMGVEWIHRMLQEPRRMFHRYIILDLPFAFRLWAVSAGRGVTGWRRKLKADNS